jgi:hypothetical protein
MLCLIGTIPLKDLPVLSGEIIKNDHNVTIGKDSFPIHRGFQAMITAAAMVCSEMGLPPPVGFTVGDVGLGDGSRKLYSYLKDNLLDIPAKILTFHYLMPDVFWHDQLLWTIEKRSKKPILIADAGYMYVAKMSGFAPSYDLFTPDIGELAFLADEKAPHPFYTRGFILQEEHNVIPLIKRAYEGKNAARILLVKGITDYICINGEIVGEIDKPNVESLEPIGGTGDTLTGIVSALIHGGYPIEEASILGAKINRLAGQLAQPTPATQVSEIIKYIPSALRIVLKENEKMLS